MYSDGIYLTVELQGRAVLTLAASAENKSSSLGYDIVHLKFDIVMSSKVS